MDDDFKKNILKTGTTILGIVCKDGVVMAADRRASAGGSVIVSKNEKKVVPINDYLVMSGCGSAAEAQKVPKYLAAELKLKELRAKSRPSVKQAAGLLSNFRTSGQSAYLLGGFNEDGSSELYSTDPAGHVTKVEDYDANWGSGMPYVLGLLERQYKKGLTIKEGVELAKEAIKSSTQRDMASGNGIDVYTIAKNEIKQVVSETIGPDYKERE
ncbi:proteasome subunit beta [Candidatus Pacearchaeota archaeon CG10_big_fil_rev_8_21_14_0_10_32_42]|nr:MAG: proteasome subunit beta [Candidatus Pacearchaeota archaeon CG10_big_fil_rev_8_21_14_0_10_32_42]